MIKKLLVILGSLTVTFFIISGGYGIWQDNLEVEGKIDISNQYPGVLSGIINKYDMNASYEKVQNDMEYMNLNYIYLVEGNSAYSFVEDGDVNNGDMLSDNKQMAIGQSEKSIVSQNNSNVSFINKIKSINERDSYLETENYNSDSTNYMYVLDEYESRKTFGMNEIDKTNELKHYVHVEEGSNINYIYQAAGTN